MRGITRSSVMTSGWQALGELERVLAVARGAYHVDGGTAREHLRHDLAHEGGVVDHEHADRLGHHSL
jgi:hypothetical protein